MTCLRFFTGVFRRFRSSVLGREVQIVGQCRLCGHCCSDIYIQNGQCQWIKSERMFQELCQSEPEYTRFEVLGKGRKGFLLFRCTLNSCDGLCTAYEDRLSLCKNYPSKSLYYEGGWIGGDCGFRFKSVRFRDAFSWKGKRPLPRFEDVLEQEIERDRF